MNVERTIEFILGMQAKHEENWAKQEQRWAKQDERWAREEARWAKQDERSAKVDKTMAGLQALVKTGMKMLVKIQEEQKETTKAIRETNSVVRLLAETTDRRLQALEKAQALTEKRFQALMEALSRGINGRGNGRH